MVRWSPGTLLTMRYEARAYGTRDEIKRELKQAMSGHRSQRRIDEADAALNRLEAGALDEVDERPRRGILVGKILYIVEDVAPSE